jgi:hypothetical protein
MNEARLFAVFRYVALNPVGERLERRTSGWRWSSTKAARAARRSAP